jgi:predicted ATPase
MENGDQGYEKLLEAETAEARFEIDVELSPGTVNSVEKLIAEKRQGMDTKEKSKKRITERFLRYTITIQILPNSGHLRIMDESLGALKRNGEEKVRKPFLEREFLSGKERLHLRMEGRAHPTYYDLGLDHTVVSMPLYEPHYPHIAAFRDEISAWRFYYFEPRTLMREYVPAAKIEAIGPRGENLAAFLNTIKSSSDKQIEAFNLALTYLLPSIESIDVHPTKEGLLSFLYTSSKTAFPIQAESFPRGR